MRSPEFGLPKSDQEPKKIESQRLNPVIFSADEISIAPRSLERLGDPEVINFFDLPNREKNPNAPTSWVEELAEIRQVSATEMQTEIPNWIFFPWANKMVLLPAENEFLEVLYSRNFPIISREEQANLKKTKMAIAGLSVGSNIAEELVRAGIMNISIADKDTIAGSNIPRLRTGSVLNVGEKKTHELAKRLYELNPYVNVEIYNDGITEENVDKFVNENDIIIDEIDSFPIKVRLREKAREYDRPLLMATDVGLLEEKIDVEGKDRPFFGGRVDESELELLLTPPKDKAEATRRFLHIMGNDMPVGTILNFINILEGKQNYWSQTSLTCSSGAAEITALVIKIANGKFNDLSATIKRKFEIPKEQDIKILRAKLQELLQA